MADPFKLTVLKALTDAFKEITPDNGYTHDLSDFDPGDGVAQSRVFRGRAWFGEDDPIPMVCILEGVEEPEDVSALPLQSEGGEYDWELLVQGFVNDDRSNPTDPAYTLLADVRKRLAVERVRKNAARDADPLGLGLGTGKNCITKLSFGSGVCRPADDVSAKAWWWLRVRLRIYENAAEPDA